MRRVCCQFFLHLLPRLPRFGHRAFILDRGNVTGIFIERDSFEDAAHNLAGPGLGQHADEVQLADHGDWS